jgi:hypothetical protein
MWSASINAAYVTLTVEQHTEPTTFFSLLYPLRSSLNHVTGIDHATAQGPPTVAKIQAVPQGKFNETPIPTHESTY